MRQGPAFLVCLAAALWLPQEARGFFLSKSPLPSPVTKEIFLEKLALNISYSAEHKQANWVFYPLGREELRNCVGRANNFRPDPALRNEDSAQLIDFSGSGFDRGHLSPAADNKWHHQAMQDSFLLSNISPQHPRFNQGIWARLENSVRAWASNFQGIYVATGPALEEGLPKIGSGLSVPKYYFKALLTQMNAKASAIGFLLPTNAEGDLSKYAVSIDFLEEFTGIDFFSGVENEEELEKAVPISNWNPSASYKPSPCAKSPHEFFALPEVE
jgi:endonuclease G, mitochondrial